MSFSKRCKKEILKKEPDYKEIDMELLSYLYFQGSIRIVKNSYQILFQMFHLLPKDLLLS